MTVRHSHGRLRTLRQHEVMGLHFWEQQTQVEIAQRLAISQPTVDQHLSGKRRNGKQVGGAIRKLRKAVRTEAPRGENVFAKVRALLDQGARSFPTPAWQRPTCSQVWCAAGSVGARCVGRRGRRTEKRWKVVPVFVQNMGRMQIGR